MRKSGRYDISGLVEAQYEPGSKGLVLRNLLGVKSKKEMDKLEALALEKTVDRVIKVYDEEHRFTAKDICEIHRIWFSELYEWAGRYRQINLHKGDFMFASTQQIPVLMKEFEDGHLRKFTPCRFKDKGKLITALAVTHTEFILIHPFREGNGRIGRVMATLMALQAGLPLLDFRGLSGGRGKHKYFSAVRAGLNRDYRLMEDLFKSVVRRSSSGT